MGDDGESQIPALLENERAVRNVQACRHLGTVAQAGADMGGEIASRASAGQAATHALSRPLYGNEGPPQHVRVQVAKACVATKCLHQAGDVGLSSGHQLQRAHRPPPPGQRWKSNEAVRRRCGEEELVRGVHTLVAGVVQVYHRLHVVEEEEKGRKVEQEVERRIKVKRPHTHGWPWR